MKERRRPDLDVYRWRERFRRSAFTVLRAEYADRVNVRGLVQQLKNAAQRLVPGRKVSVRVTDAGDVVVRVTRRTTGARRAA